MGDADGDEGESSGMRGRRHGVTDRSGGVVLLYVASVGIVWQGKRSVHKAIV